MKKTMEKASGVDSSRSTPATDTIPLETLIIELGLKRPQLELVTRLTFKSSDAELTDQVSQAQAVAIATCQLMTNAGLKSEEALLLLRHVVQELTVFPEVRTDTLLSIQILDGRFAAWAKCGRLLDLQTGERIHALPASPIISVAFVINNLYDRVIKPLMCR